MSQFRSKFFTDFFISIYRIEKENWDTIRFPNGDPRKNQFMLDHAVQRMNFIARNMDAFESSYELLEDEVSRALFVKLLEYNVLDHHHVHLPLSSEAYWKFCQDIDLNPGYDGRIRIAPYAMFSTSGIRLAFQERGPSTCLEFGHESPAGVETISIDDYATQCGLERVDFIKMDIEGAEDAAISGATKTIRRFRPKLAISAYHKRDDMIILPRRILDILPEYRFYLEHYTIHSEETVLYAAVVPASAHLREDGKPWPKL